MSWLGGSISSITGQISSIAKEVLSEHPAEIEGGERFDIKSALNKIKALEETNISSAAEVSRLDKNNQELTNRLHQAESRIRAFGQRYEQHDQQREDCLDGLHAPLQEATLRKNVDKCARLRSSLSLPELSATAFPATSPPESYKRLTEPRLQHELCDERNDVELTRRVAELETALEAAESARQTTAGDLTSLQTERDDLTSSLQQLDLQNQAALDQVERWRQEKTRLNEVVEQLEQAALADKLALKECREHLTGQLEACSLEVTSSREECEELRRQMSEIQQQNNGHVRTLEVLQSYFEQMTQVSEEQRQQHCPRDSTTASLEGQVAEDVVISLETVRDELLQQSKQQTNESQKTGELHRLLSATDEALEVIRWRLTDAEDQHTAVGGDLRRFKDRLEDFVADFKELKDQNCEAENREDAASSDPQDPYQQVLSEVASLYNTIADYKQKTLDYESQLNKQSSAEEISRQLAQFSIQLELGQNESEALKLRLEEKENELESQRSGSNCLASALEEIEELKLQVGQTPCEELVNLRTRCQSLERINADLQSKEAINRVSSAADAVEEGSDVADEVSEGGGEQETETGDDDGVWLSGAFVSRLRRILSDVYPADDVVSSSPSELLSLVETRLNRHEMPNSADEEDGLSSAVEKIRPEYGARQEESEKQLLLIYSEKLPSISEDAERVVELQAEVLQLRESCECDSQQELRNVMQERDDLSQQLLQAHEATMQLNKQLSSTECDRDYLDQILYEKEEIQCRFQVVEQESETLRLKCDEKVDILHKSQREIEEENTNLNKRIAELMSELENSQSSVQAIMCEGSNGSRQKVNPEKSSEDSETPSMSDQRRDEHLMTESKLKLAEKDECSAVTTSAKHQGDMSLLSEEVDLLYREGPPLTSGSEPDTREMPTSSESAEEVAHLDQLIKEKDINIIYLQQQLDALRQQLDEYVCERESELSSLRREVTESCDALLCEKDAELSSMKVSLQETLEELSSAKDSAETELSSVQTELAELQQRRRDEAAALGSEQVALGEKLKSLNAERDVWMSERQQLISALSQKHAENVQYHGEIQRLAAALADAETQLAQLVADESQRAAQLQTISCELERARRARDQLDTQCADAIAQRDQLRTRIGDAETTAKEQNDALDDERRRLQLELERLRRHLYETEETYTQEALKAEQRESVLKRQLRSELSLTAESEAASRRFDALQDELNSVVQQRDDVTLQMDDVTHSLNNLQHVLEQFQRDKHREITTAVSAAQRQAEQLQQQMETMQEQLDDARQGLLAANRLNEQLDRKEDTIMALKAEVEAKQKSLHKLLQEASDLRSNSSGKVDKSLVKNLVVGLVSAPSGQQRHVLRVIATVLDFSGEERRRVLLDSAPAAAAAPSTGQQASLSQAFVRFLEQESTPRLAAALDGDQMVAEATRKLASRVSRASPAPRTTPGHSRAGSASNPLLLGAQTAAEQLAPVNSSSAILRAIIDDTPPSQTDADADHAETET